jgi:hypothetical protein
MFALGFATTGVLALGFAGPRVLCNSDTSGSGTSQDRGTAVAKNRSIILLMQSKQIFYRMVPESSQIFSKAFMS